MILVFDSWRIHHELMVVCRKIQPPCRFPHSSRSLVESDVAKSARWRKAVSDFLLFVFQLCQEVLWEVDMH